MHREALTVLFGIGVGTPAPIVYYLSGNTGRGKEFGGRPTAEWRP